MVLIDPHLSLSLFDRHPWLVPLGTFFCTQIVIPAGIVLRTYFGRMRAKPKPPAKKRRRRKI